MLNKSQIRSLDNKICPYCGGHIQKNSEGGGSENYICQLCKSIYCFSLTWELIKKIK